MNELIDRFNAVPMTNKIILVVVLVIGIFVGYFMVLHQPMTDEIQSLQAEAVEYQEKQRNLQGAQERHQQLEEKIRELENELARAEDTLPDSAEIPGLLERVYRDAEMQGLTIETFQRHSDIADDDADYVQIPVEMELVGSFDQIANFFAAVGQRGRIINIEDITIDRTESGMVPDGELQVTAQATTYRWSPDS